MPKLPPHTQAARRDHILDAAEACFIETGFHATSMQDICKQAQVSPGALYTYFVSKEQLIAGLCERENERLTTDLAMLAAAPDFLIALRALGDHYCCQEPISKVRLHIEIGAEAGRNQAIGDIIRACDEKVRQGFVQLLAREQAAGRIHPQFSLDIIARTICTLGDGVFWHRNLDPNFDPDSVLDAMMVMLSTLLIPQLPSQHILEETQS